MSVLLRHLLNRIIQGCARICFRGWVTFQTIRTKADQKPRAKGPNVILNTQT